MIEIQLQAQAPTEELQCHHKDINNKLIKHQVLIIDKGSLLLWVHKIIIVLNHKTIVLCLMMLHQTNLEHKINCHMLIIKVGMPFHLKILTIKDSNSNKFIRETCSINNNNNINSKWWCKMLIKTLTIELLCIKKIIGKQWEEIFRQYLKIINAHNNLVRM